MNRRARIWIPDIAPRLSTIEVPIDMPVLAGFFRLELIDAKTQRVKRILEFSNILTDTGFNAIGNGTKIADLRNYLGVGTNNAVPTTGDTALGAEVSRTNSNEGIGEVTGFVTGTTWPSNKSGSYHFSRLNRVFLEGEGNGNLTELGWFDQSSAGTLVIRSLIKDSSGTPITLTKTSNDQLRVKHELRLYPPPTPITGTVIVGPTTCSYTSSILNMNSTLVWGFDTVPTVQAGIGVQLGIWSWVVKAMPSASVIIDQTGSTANFSDGGTQASSSVNQTYVDGTFQLDALSTWTGSHANFGPGGIKGFVATPSVFTGGELHQIVISPVIAKNVGQTLVLKFRQAYNRTVI